MGKCGNRSVLGLGCFQDVSFASTGVLTRADTPLNLGWRAHAVQVWGLDWRGSFLCPSIHSGFLVSNPVLSFLLYALYLGHHDNFKEALTPMLQMKSLQVREEQQFALGGPKFEIRFIWSPNLCSLCFPTVPLTVNRSATETLLGGAPDGHIQAVECLVFLFSNCAQTIL